MNLNFEFIKMFKIFLDAEIGIDSLVVEGLMHSKAVSSKLFNKYSLPELKIYFENIKKNTIPEFDLIFPHYNFTASKII